MWVWIKRIAKGVGIIVLAYACLGLVTLFTPIGPLQDASVQVSQDRCHKIYLRRNTLHMALVVNSNDLRELGGENLANLSKGKWVDFGWGDHTFYTRLSDLSGLRHLRVVLNALLWPSFSSIHVAGFDVEPMKVYLGAKIPYFQTMEFMKTLPREIIELKVPSSNLSNMIAFLNGEFQNMTPIQKGRFTDGNFYSSTSKYHLLATCNSWAAEGLRQAGFDMNPRTAILPKLTLAQIRSQDTNLCPAGMPMADGTDAKPVIAEQ